MCAYRVGVRHVSGVYAAGFLIKVACFYVSLKSSQIHIKAAAKSIRIQTYNKCRMVALRSLICLLRIHQQHPVYNTKIKHNTIFVGLTKLLSIYCKLSAYVSFFCYEPSQTVETFFCNVLDVLYVTVQKSIYI